MKLRGLEWPDHEFSALLGSHREGPSAKQPSYRGAGHSSCLSPSSGFHFPVSLQTYSNKPITSSCRSGWAPHPFDTTRLLLQPPHGPAWRDGLPFWGEQYVTGKLLSSHLSSIRCHGSHHPCSLGWKPPPPQ